MKLLQTGYQFVHQDPLFVINRPEGLREYVFLVIRSPFRLSFFQQPEQEYERNAIVLIGYETPHRYSGIPGKGPFINDWIRFEAESAELSMTELPMNTVFVPLADHMVQRVSRLIYDITTERREAKAHSEPIVNLLLQCLLWKTSQLIRENQNNRISHPRYEEMARARNYLLNSFQEEADIRQLARQAHMSTSYFRHVYKELFGVSPQLDRIQTRLEYAKEQLQTTSLPVALIARECGYQNEEHFMRQFKQYLGCTPSTFRNLKGLIGDT